MDFSWSPAQLELRNAISAFARRALNDDLVTRDRKGTFSHEAWRACAEIGIQGMPFSAEHGGGGHEIMTTVLGMQALGYGCRDGGLLFGLNAQMWSVQMPIHRFGTEDQKKRYLAPLCRGTAIGAHGMTEPDSGSDAFALRTIARRAGDSYVLNGTKTFVSSAPVADVFIVFATVDATAGMLGVTAFLVERDTPGLRVGRVIEKSGLRTSPMAELILEDCVVPTESMLGREGRGAAIFNDSMEWERACIMSPCIGAMERQLEACVRTIRRARRGGADDSAAHLLAPMKVRLESARLVLNHAAWTKSRGEPAGGSASTAKLFVSEAWKASCLDAVRIQEAYTTDEDAERDLRDAIGGTLYSGTSEIQRAIIARALGI